MNLFLTKTVLFQGISEEELDPMLKCVGAVTKSFEKEDRIYQMGDFIDAFGLVLCGGVRIESNDMWGNKSILDYVEAGQVFAETYACIPNEPLMVHVIAMQKTEILFLNASRLLQTCSHFCGHHQKLIQNLLLISAQKNLNLSRRIFHTSSKTIRGRLLSYLSDQAIKEKKDQFTIPFNRQQMADYLGVDRSALSNELSKMQKEHILTFQKNKFCLKRKWKENEI